MIYKERKELIETEVTEFSKSVTRFLGMIQELVDDDATHIDQLIAVEKYWQTTVFQQIEVGQAFSKYIIDLKESQATNN